MFGLPLSGYPITVDKYSVHLLQPVSAKVRALPAMTSYDSMTLGLLPSD